MSECLYCGAGSSHLVKTVLKGVLQETRCLKCGRTFEPKDPFAGLLSMPSSEIWGMNEAEIQEAAWQFLNTNQPFADEWNRPFFPQGSESTDESP